MSGKKKKPDGDSSAQGSFNLGASEPKTSLAAKAVPPPDEDGSALEQDVPEEPKSPEQAIPALTEQEPTNPDMSNPQPLSQSPPPAKKSGSKKSTLITGISVMGSRLMGVVREQIFAFMFGSTAYAEAFLTAFRIPNLLRDLFAEGALSTAFTTTFTKTYTKEGPEAAWHLARLVVSALTLVLGTICLVGVFCAPEIVNLISPGFAQVPGKFELTVRLTQLMFPFILFVSLAAAVMGMLNARNVFGIPASASTVFNIVSVVAGAGLALWFEPQSDWHHPHFGEAAVFGWTFGVLIGGLAQLAMQLPSLWQVGFNFRGGLNFRDSGLYTVLLLMVPSAIAGSAVQVNVAVNSQFASHIPGAQSWLYYAFRLMQLPIGIFGVAIATVTLPAVARQHALDDLKAFGKTVEDALRFGFYLTLPASIGLAVISQPVIQLIYEHGTFTAQNTRDTALALQAYTIGLAGYTGIKILVPCFYAMQPPRLERRPGESNLGILLRLILFTPARVSLTGIALNLALCYVFFYICGLRQVGLAMATGGVAVLNFLQLVWAIQKKIDLGNTGDWLSFFAKVTTATMACGGVALLGDHLLLAHRTTHSLLGAAILFINISAAGVVYFGVTTLLGVPESVEMAALIKRKLGKSNSARK